MPTQSFLCILLSLSIGCLSGCAQRIQYQEVLIPTKCSVAKRDRPTPTQDVLKDSKNLLIYTESLEMDLKMCRGEE